MANDKLWVQIIFLAFSYLNIHIILVSDFDINLYKRKYQWSGGSVLPLSTQVRGFKPGRSRQDFSGRKNPQHAFLRKGSKAVGPVSQICGT